MAETTTKQTVIEDGTEFDGSLSSRCPISLSGTVKGELLAPVLNVTPSGSVHGCVRVERLVCRGEISGEIQAQSVELSGKVSDQTVITAETLEVRLSQPGEGVRVTFGNCELNVGGKRVQADRPLAPAASPAPAALPGKTKPTL